MSTLTTEELQERFLQLAEPVLKEYESQIERLMLERFAEFKKKLDAKTEGATSGFHREKLNQLMDKLIERMTIIKDNFLAQFSGKVHRAIVEAEDATELSDSMMRSFIDDNSASAIEGHLTLFKEESTKIIIEGLGELSLDDRDESPEEDLDNSMSESDGGSELPTSDYPGSEFSEPLEESGKSEGSEQVENSDQYGEVPLRIPTGEKEKKKRKSLNLGAIVRKKVAKTNSGNYRPLPGSKAD
jgi:hypothetical protein